MPIYGWKRRQSGVSEDRNASPGTFSNRLKTDEQVRLGRVDRFDSRRGSVKKDGGNDIRKGCGIVVSSEVRKMHGGVVIEGGTLAKWLP
jgi:hypothetical protein